MLLLKPLIKNFETNRNFLVFFKENEKSEYTRIEM